MVHIAAVSQATENVIDQETSACLSFGDFATIPDEDRAYAVAFVGYAVWRRDENGDGNLSDQQVFIIRDGHARLLPPHNDLRNHSPDGFSWSYLGSGPAQLAMAILMEVSKTGPAYSRSIRSSKSAS